MGRGRSGLCRGLAGTTSVSASVAPWQWLAAATCVALQTCLTFFLQVPGCPTGYLGPGGKADNGTHWNCTGGAARFIDVTVFGEEHIYQSPTSHHVYGGVAHDPEGLLGTLNRWPFIKS